MLNARQQEVGAFELGGEIWFVIAHGAMGSFAHNGTSARLFQPEALAEAKPVKDRHLDQMRALAAAHGMLMGINLKGVPAPLRRYFLEHLAVIEAAVWCAKDDLEEEEAREGDPETL